MTAVPASRLIAQFRETHPGITQIDTRRKRWVLSRTVSAKNQLASHAPDVEEYMALTSQADLPWIVDARQTFLDPAPSVFSTLQSACLTRRGVSILYTSMNNPAGTQRVIYPHAIVRGSQRWHTRAWCAERHEYRDFALGRISSPSLVDEEPKQLPPDQAWDTLIEVRVGAHSALGHQQEKVILGEYFKGTMGRRFSVRAALVHYVLNEIRAATDPKRQIPPEYLLEVTNLDDLRPHLFSNRPHHGASE